MRAAKAGHVEAQYYLGVSFSDGTGVSIDLAQAAAWYHRAADSGHPRAENALGVCYAKGEGVAVDPAQAVAFFRRVADGGFANAQFNLGCMYASGCGGLPRDLVTAAALWRLAAAAGLKEAAQALLDNQTG